MLRVVLAMCGDKLTSIYYESMSMSISELMYDIALFRIHNHNNKPKEQLEI